MGVMSHTCTDHKVSATHIIGVVCRHPNSSYEYLPDKLQLTIADLNETN